MSGEPKPSPVRPTPAPRVFPKGPDADVVPPEFKKEAVVVPSDHRHSMRSQVGEIDFILLQLGDKNFSTAVWESFLPSLSELSLTEVQARNLLDTLLSHASVAKSANFAALEALADCFCHVDEVVALFSQVQDDNQEPLKSLVENLALRQVLYERLRDFLEDLKGDRAEFDPSECSRRINPYLVILHRLWKSCPIFTDFTIFFKLSLRGEDVELFWNFLQVREEGVKRRSLVVSRADVGFREEGWKTAQIMATLERIQHNQDIEDSFKKLPGLSKNKDFENLRKEWKYLRSATEKSQSALLAEMRRREQATPGKPSLGEQREHRNKVLAVMERYSTKLSETVEFFCDKQLAEGVRLTPHTFAVIQQARQLCGDAVACILYGLMKTGKSTLLDALLQRKMSAARVEPMTAVPVRYVHDPESEEPVMVVPFYKALNKVSALIKRHFTPTDLPQDGIKKLHNEALHAVAMIQVRNLLEVILSDAGLTFKEVYAGSEPIFEASFFIHDLFRLAVSIKGLPASIIKELPSNWGNGLDSHLTVYFRFPSAFEIPNHVQLSIIDTPGVNEDGVKKLELHKMIISTIELSNHLIYTNIPPKFLSTDNASLRTGFIVTRESSTITSDVFITYADTRNVGQDFIQSVGAHLKKRKGESTYPLEQIHPISGKRKLLGELMLELIGLTGRLPTLRDNPDLVNDFASSMDGLTPQEKLRNYEGKSLEEIKTLSERLIQASNLKEPVEKIFTTLTRFNILMASNRHLEKSLDNGRYITKYLQQLSISLEEEQNNAQKLRSQFDTVCNKVVAGSAALQREQEGFLRQLNQDLRVLLERKQKEFIKSELPAIINEDDNWSFGTEQEADAKVVSILNEVTHAFVHEVEETWKDQEGRVSTILDDLRARCQTIIFDPMAEIQEELREMPQEDVDFHLAKTEVSLNPDILRFKGAVINSQKQSVSFVKKMGTAIGLSKPRGQMFEVSLRGLTKMAEEQVADHVKNLLSSAEQEMDKVVRKTKDGWIIKALQKLGQFDEAFRTRGRLVVDAPQIDRMLEDLRGIEREMKALIKPIPGYN